MPKTRKTTIRMTEEDEKNVQRIIASGAASNTAEAIRVALAIVPVFLALGRGQSTA